MLVLYEFSENEIEKKETKQIKNAIQTFDDLIASDSLVSSLGQNSLCYSNI